MTARCARDAEIAEKKINQILCILGVCLSREARDPKKIHPLDSSPSLRRGRLYQKIMNIEHPAATPSVLGWFKDGYILNGLIWTQTGFKALRAGRTFNIEF